MHDQSYREACEDWWARAASYQNRTYHLGDEKSYIDDPDAMYAEAPYFWDWDGMPPDKDSYRPEWAPEDAPAFQVYETVSEGTPVSPVFQSEGEMRAWLAAQGYSPEAVDGFLSAGHAPSLVIFRSSDGRLDMAEGIEAAGITERHRDD